MSLFKQNEQCSGILRAFICSSKDENCMLVYKHNTKAYACLLRDKLMTEEQYRKIYNPHHIIGDKIYNGEISIENEVASAILALSTFNSSINTESKSKEYCYTDQEDYISPALRSSSCSSAAGDYKEAQAMLGTLHLLAESTPRISIL
jgi:hypothetical protein